MRSWGQVALQHKYKCIWMLMLVSTWNVIDFPSKRHIQRALVNKMKISIQKKMIKGISTYGKLWYNSPHAPPLLPLPTPSLEALDLV